jgi:hypothetical protein
MEEQLKKLKAQVIHRHKTEENWNSSSYIPVMGEVVFYDIDETHNYVRQKNGDGIHRVKELPFTTTEKELSKKQD